MSYQLYRNTTLGNTLQESLDELIQYGQITPQLAFKVLLQFDKCINSALSQRVKARVTFKANKLNTYRFCDNVWTLMLNDVEFREVHEFAKVDKVKIVACDGKNAVINDDERRTIVSVADVDSSSSLITACQGFKSKTCSYVMLTST
ncbi:unnamed protein product [Hermetia illucens]|uniref:Transcription initiation factor IIA subunit 2 n=2 Tax=Hermetia illucens TaxID=343691 RepID=A0A7R8YZH2_HERIL|nr:unnamed protein product [Hermetia illucens]